MLLDEPVAGLSPEAIELMRHVMEDERKKGVGFLVISHDIPAISDLCREMIVMNAGEVIASGLVDQVLSDSRVIDAYLGEDFHQ